MPETKNLCAKIPLALYTQVNEAKVQTGQTTNEYITSLLAEYFEMKRNGGNTTMTGNTRTMAFQIPEELFQRIKAHLERESTRLGRKFTQREFVLGLIEEALTDAEQMNAEENPTDAEQTSAEENPTDAEQTAAEENPSDIEQPDEADAYEEEELPPEKN